MRIQQCCNATPSWRAIHISQSFRELRAQRLFCQKAIMNPLAPPASLFLFCVGCILSGLCRCVEPTYRVTHRGVSCAGAWVILVFRLRKLTFGFAKTAGIDLDSRPAPSARRSTFPGRQNAPRPAVRYKLPQPLLYCFSAARPRGPARCVPQSTRHEHLYVYNPQNIQYNINRWARNRELAEESCTQLQPAPPSMLSCSRCACHWLMALSCSEASISSRGSSALSSLSAGVPARCSSSLVRD